MGETAVVCKSDPIESDGQIHWTESKKDSAPSTSVVHMSIQGRERYQMWGIPCVHLYTGRNRANSGKPKQWSHWMTVMTNRDSWWPAADMSVVSGCFGCVCVSSWCTPVLGNCTETSGLVLRRAHWYPKLRLSFSKVEICGRQPLGTEGRAPGTCLVPGTVISRCVQNHQGLAFRMRQAL